MKLLQLLLEAALDQPVILNKSVVDKIRKMNSALDTELNDPMYDNKNVYAKGGAARLGMLLYVDLVNNTKNHVKDVVRDQDFVWIWDEATIKDFNDFSSNAANYDKYDTPEKLLGKKYLNKEGQRELAIHELELIEKGGPPKYFKSRDFTINQALINRDSLIFSRKAFRDASKNIVNPTWGFGNRGTYEYDPWEDSPTGGSYVKVSNDGFRYMSPRLFFRMMLFAARYGYKFPDLITEEDLDYYKKEADFYSYFIPILKAYELGIEKKYFDIIGEKKRTDRTLSTISALLRLTNTETGRLDIIKWMKKELVSTVINLKYNKKAAEKKYGFKTPEEWIKLLYKEIPEIKKEVDKVVLDKNTKKTLTYYSDPEVYNKYLKKKNRQKYINK